MKMFLFKFHQNRTITMNYIVEEEGKGGMEGTDNSKFYHNLLSVNI